MAAVNDEIGPAPVAAGVEPRPRPRPRPTVETEPGFSLQPPTHGHGQLAPFAFSPDQLHSLIEARSQTALRAFGGLPGLVKGLQTDQSVGLGADEDVVQETVTFQDAVGRTHKPYSSKPVNIAAPPTTSKPGAFTTRRDRFGDNRVPRRKPKSFLQLLWLAYNDKLMFLLTASAAVSLALGIYQSVSSTEEGPAIEWVEGVAILVAVIIIVLATAVNDYQKNYKFQKLNQRKDERMVTVLRSGQHRSVSIFDVVVGDVLHLETGDVAPADGVLIEGSGIQCDESSLTGESDLVDKVSALQQAGDPFILSGTRVVAGVGRFLVLCVGRHSAHGRILASLDDEVQETPLQQKLGVLAKYIINVGLAAGIIFFAVMFIRFLARLGSIEGGPRAKGQEFLDLLILAITVIVIVVPEGLPLTVTLALAFATTRMLRDKNLVRLLRSCETMGNATTVCCDKTGTLTQNNMSVVAGVLGTDASFSRDEDNASLDMRKLRETLSPELIELLKASTAVNSTAMETETRGEFIGSGTETALLRFAQDTLGMGPVGEERSSTQVVQMIPFDPKRKWMGVIVEVGPGQHRLLVKGAAEVVLQGCSHTIPNPSTDSSPIILTAGARTGLVKQVTAFAEQLLRVVAVAYKDLGDWAPATSPTILSLSGLTFTAAFGIRDPLRPHVADSVTQCREAGVFVRMVTGDNFTTAKAIASECGIYTAGGIAMDGPKFRKLTPAQLDLVAPRLQVLARSSPDDKKRLVMHLKSLDEVVAVTGDGTNDALALKAADVGFSMGLSGTEVAKEASAIVLMDDNFASIVKAIAWGRAVNDATKKFLQFQFTINVTAGLLTVISAMVSGAEASIFTVVQLLWINLLMDTFAALALSTDFPAQSSLLRRPEPRTASILNTTMWKMVMGQSAYQMVVMFTLYYAGPELFGVETAREERQLQTMTFNIYVWMQFFNQWNCRRADNQLNIFEGVLRNPWFMFVQAVTLGGQLAIVFVGGEAFQTVSLTASQWGWSMLFGFVTVPLGMLIRLVPDEHVRTAWVWSTAPLRRVPRTRQKNPRVNEEEKAPRWFRNAGGKIAGALGFEKPQGGRMTDSRDQEMTAPDSTAAEVGQGSFDLEGAVEAARYRPSDAPAGFEVHPGTRKEDPVLDLEERGKGVPPSQNPMMWAYTGSGIGRGW